MSLAQVPVLARPFRGPYAELPLTKRPRSAPQVAIKRLKPNLSAREQATLAKELSIMQGLPANERITAFIGVVDRPDGVRGLVMARWGGGGLGAYTEGEGRAGNPWQPW